jgi:hypothetical protein
MSSSKHYLLANLMASFTVSNESSRSISSADIDLSDYLSVKQGYSNITLRPVLIEDGGSLPLVAQPELLGSAIAAHYFEAYYHVEIFNESINQFLLCDSLNAAMALLGMPEDEGMLLIPVELGDINDRRINKKTLLSRRNAVVGERNYPDDYIDWIRSSYGYDLQNLIWTLATTLVEDEVLLYAALFIREAIRDYQFRSNCDVEKALHDIEQLPETISESVRIENAIHNCYKAVEAIHGGNLPKDEAKIIRSFQGKEIDLTQLTGFKFEGIALKPAIEKVIALRKSRNYKSAHGRIGANRKSTFYELMDFQKLAIHLVMSAIYPRTGVNILHPVVAG